jgi:hypothetical protein
VNLAEMVHRTVYVERGVATADGEPHRHVDDIFLGADAASSTRGFGSGQFGLTADGALMSAEGNEVDPQVRKTAMLARLNGMHLAGRAYAQKHCIRVLQPAAPAPPKPHVARPAAPRPGR